MFQGPVPANAFSPRHGSQNDAPGILSIEPCILLWMENHSEMHFHISVSTLLSTCWCQVNRPQKYHVT